jgi:hypothetical protein
VSFDHVPDGYQADQLVGLQDRQVPDALLGHEVHDVAQVVARQADNQVFGHDGPYRRRGTVRADARKFPDDVALGEDTDRFVVGVDHQQHANAMLSEQAAGVEQRFVLSHRDDVPTFGAKNVLDFHDSLPHSQPSRVP